MDDPLCGIGGNAYSFGGAVYQLQSARWCYVAYRRYDDWLGGWGAGECVAKLCRPGFAQAVYHLDVRLACCSRVGRNAMAGCTLSCGYSTCHTAHQAAQWLAARRRLCGFARYSGKTCAHVVDSLYGFAGGRRNGFLRTDSFRRCGCSAYCSRVDAHFQPSTHASGGRFGWSRLAPAMRYHLL